MTSADSTHVIVLPGGGQLPTLRTKPAGGRVAR